MTRKLAALAEESPPIPPPASFLRLLLMAREVAVTVAFRYISMANRRHLSDLLENLNSLIRGLAESAPALPPAWKSAAEGFGKSLSGMRLEELVQALEDSNFKHLWLRGVPILPGRASPLLKRSYRRILLVTGPGLGLGDEIACAEMIRVLRRRCAGAALSVYSYYPGAWRLLEPESSVHSLSRDPMRAFQAVEALIRDGRAADTLVLFVSFTRTDFHLAFLDEPGRPDVGEFSLAKGVFCWAERGSAHVEVIPCLDPSYANQYDALRRLLGRLVGRWKPETRGAPPRRLRRARNEPFRILLNPLTSKPIVFQPDDWVGLLDAALPAVPGRRPVLCTVIPGLEERSQAFISKVIAKARRRSREGLEVRLLQRGGRSWGPRTAIGIVAAEMRRSDLVLGVDTYTSHLAALYGIPSLSFCNDRSSHYWSDQPHAWWIEFGRGVRALGEMTALLASLSGLDGVSRAEWATRHPWAGGCESFARLAGRYARAASMPRAALRRWRRAGDLAWEGLPAGTRRLLADMDESYAWPLLRALLAQPGVDPSQLEWIRNVCRHTHFFRLCGFAAAARQRLGVERG